jgi:hypothetical protein
MLWELRLTSLARHMDSMMPVDRVPRDEPRDSPSRRERRATCPKRVKTVLKRTPEPPRRRKFKESPPKTGPGSNCFKCDQGGHYARECKRERAGCPASGNSDEWTVVVSPRQQRRRALGSALVADPRAPMSATARREKTRGLQSEEEHLEREAADNRVRRMPGASGESRKTFTGLRSGHGMVPVSGTRVIGKKGLN